MKPQTNKQTNGPAYLYTQTNNQANKEKFLFALLFIVPVIIAGLLEILNA